jgi:ABC transport permease subunit
MPGAPLPAPTSPPEAAPGSAGRLWAAVHRATAAIGRATHASLDETRTTLGFIGELLQAVGRVGSGTLGGLLRRGRAGARSGHLPDAHARSHLPGAHARSHLPDAHARSHLPGAHARSHLPDAHARSHLPDAHARSHLRGADLLAQLEQSGPRSLPIVSLVSGLVGVILAYMGAVQLQRFGAQTFIADLVTIGAVREVAALMTGVILSGRIGASFAAQLGSMQANEEIDALRALGVDPMEHLVLPRVLGLVLVAPLLTAYAALVAVLAGGLVASLIFGVPAEQYAYKALQSLTLTHVLVGLGKGTVYGLLVALAGCRQGLHAGRSAQAVGQAVTASVVQAIVWIVVAASALTVALQRLGW